MLVGLYICRLDTLIGTQINDDDSSHKGDNQQSLIKTHNYHLVGLLSIGYRIINSINSRF